MVRIHPCPPKYIAYAMYFFLLKRWIRKGSCRALSRSGADQSEGKNSPVDYFSDAARRNPSLPTKIHSVSYVFFLLKRWIRKGSCRALSRSGADQSEGKNSPVDYFSDAARRNPSLPTKHITYVMCFFMLKDR